VIERTSHTYLDPLVATEPIELVEQFQHRPLHLPVTALLRIESLVPIASSSSMKMAAAFFLGYWKASRTSYRTVTNERLHNDGRAS